LDEYIVVDAAGRLQIPLELREESGIGQRVKLESTPEGVLIRPVVGRKDGPAGVSGVVQNQASPEAPEGKTRGWSRWLRRMRK
jgi:bifunctional DNA-binding transcriptional regulator/antitoxin component of YhaV-PrlF toxin-antitoxin module